MKDLKENSSPVITISHLITMLENHTPVPLRLRTDHPRFAIHCQRAYFMWDMYRCFTWNRL